jgi:hypothetical protein
MKELSRVQLIAIENGYFWAQFQNMVTGKTEVRCDRTLSGFHCAMTKYHNKVSRLYNHLSQKEN